MLGPKYVLILAVGALLVVSGIFHLGRRRRGGRDGAL